MRRSNIRYIAFAMFSIFNNSEHTRTPSRGHHRTQRPNDTMVYCRIGHPSHLINCHQCRIFRQGPEFTKKFQLFSQAHRTSDRAVACVDANLHTCLLIHMTGNNPQTNSVLILIPCFIRLRRSKKGL